MVMRPFASFLGAQRSFWGATAWSLGMMEGEINQAASRPGRVWRGELAVGQDRFGIPFWGGIGTFTGGTGF